MNLAIRHRRYIFQWRQDMIKKVIIILLFSALPSVSAWANNFEQKNIAEIKSILRKAEPYYFPANVKIKPFGEVANFKVYITELIWGNLRETKRLVLLSKDSKYLGNYGLDALPRKIENNKIIFDVDPESGNEINLSKGIPEEIYIDGQTILFEKANSNENFKKGS
jgi:hypothetical protein